MFLRKTAATTVGLNTEAQKSLDKQHARSARARNIIKELGKDRYIKLTPGMQVLLGTGLTGGALLNWNDRPLLGALRGAGTMGGLIGGYKGSRVLADKLMEATRLSEFDDTSKDMIRTGMGFGGSILGALLANKIIRKTTEKE